MKLLMENWRRYLNEKKLFKKAKIQPYNFDWGLLGETEEQEEVEEEVLDIPTLMKKLQDNPNREIDIDKPKGTSKSFGTDQSYELPFDYCELNNLINPIDGMGLYLIIVPSTGDKRQNLIPVGQVAYNNKNRGNDKIIVAHETNYTEEDKKIIEEFFEELPFFDPVEWY